MRIYALAALPALNFAPPKQSGCETEKQRFLKIVASIAANASAMS
jgi:hypothetical protein